MAYKIKFTLLITLLVFTINISHASSSTENFSFEVSSKKIMSGTPALLQWTIPETSVCNLNGTPIEKRYVVRQDFYLIENPTVDTRYTLTCTDGLISKKIVKKVNVVSEKKKSPTVTTSITDKVISYGVGGKNKSITANLNWASTNAESCTLNQYFNNFRTVNFKEESSPLDTHGTLTINISDGAFGSATERIYLITCQNKNGVSAGSEVKFNSSTEL